MPLISAVTETPVLQRVLRGPTRSLYNVTYRSVFRQSGRYLNKSKAIQIQLGQLILPLIAGLALVYTQGREAMKADGGDRKHWLKVLTEGTLGFLTIDNSKGLFPLAAMGVGAYRAGQQPDKMSKAQELVKTAMVALMGYFGVQLGAVWSEAADKADENELRTLLDKYSSLEKAMPKITAGNAANTASDEALAGIKTAVGTLRRSLDSLGTTGKKSPELLAQLNTTADKAKTELVDHFTTLQKEQAANGGKTLAEALEKSLTGHFGAKSKLPETLAEHLELVGLAVHNAQEGYIQIARRLNPIFGYIIAGSLLGIPLAKQINKWLENRYPEWRKSPGPQFFAPYPPNPAMQAHKSEKIGAPTVYIPGMGSF